MAWKSIIRFRDTNGQIRFGEPLGDDLKKATIWNGNSVLNLTATQEESEVVELLAPHTPDTIVCIGLNYRSHAEEAGFAIPSYPVVFYKPKTAITDPYADITIHRQALDTVDYENELAAIVSRDAKDVSEEDAYEYILGYTVGNDVSAREWQKPDRSGGQASYAKGFDGFNPIGPKIVAADVVGDPQNLKMVTRRNGDVVQDGNTADMIFGVYQLISFISQGRTLPAGSLIMTGTPPGVAMFASKPPNFIKKGEVLDCEIEKIGSLRNRFV